MGDRAYTRDGFKPKLTPAARSHPATSLSLDPRGNEARWAALPPLEGINRVARLKPGASALLVHPTQRTEAGEQAPVLAVTDAGKGRTLALLTDTSWHWGFLAAGHRRRRPHLPALLGQRHPLAGARSGPDAAAGGAGPGGVPPGPAGRRPGAHACTPTTPRPSRCRCSWPCTRRRTPIRPSPCARCRSPPTRTARPTWTCPGWRRALTAWSARPPSTAAASPRSRPSSSAPRARELEDVISQRAVLKEIAEVTGGELYEDQPGRREDPPAARGAGRQPAHGRAVVEPAAAAAGDRPSGHRMGPAPPRRARLGHAATALDGTRRDRHD